MQEKNKMDKRGKRKEGIRKGKKRKIKIKSVKKPEYLAISAYI